MLRLRPALTLLLLGTWLAPVSATASDLLWSPPEVAGGAVDSATILEQELILRGRAVTRVDSIAGLDLSLHEAVWVTLGVFPHTRPLTLAEGQQLKLYLLAGGRLSLEGGDIWGFDPLTPLHNIDGISASADGGSDLFAISGSAAPNGADFSGLSAPHTGENQFLDHIYPDEPGAGVVLSRAGGAYDVGVVHYGLLSGLGDFTVLGISFEFGGWGGDRAPLLERMLVALGLEVLCSLEAPTDPTCGSSPNGVPLAWQNLAPYSAIDVIRDGVLLATLPPTVTSYLDPSPPVGTHEYRLRVLDGSCQASTAPCTTTVAPVGQFRRGDLDGSGSLDITDAIALIGALFFAGNPLLCPDAGDVNDSGGVDIADPLVLLWAIFENGPPPAPPGIAECGADPTSDTLPRCDTSCTP